MSPSRSSCAQRLSSGAQRRRDLIPRARRAGQLCSPSYQWRHRDDHDDDHHRYFRLRNNARKNRHPVSDEYAAPHHHDAESSSNHRETEPEPKTFAGAGDRKVEAFPEPVAHDDHATADSHGQASSRQARLRFQPVRSQWRLCGRHRLHLRPESEGSLFGENLPRPLIRCS